MDAGARDSIRVLAALRLMLELEHDRTGLERMPCPLGRDTKGVLVEAGFVPREIAALRVQLDVDEARG